MITDFFEDLIVALGKQLNLPLRPDKHKACLLRINETLRVQLEYSNEKQAILLLAFLGTLPPGKFRENSLKEALKANYSPSSLAQFGYLAATSELCCFVFLPQDNLSAVNLIPFLNDFTEMASLWQTAIQTGQFPADQTPLKKQSPFSPSKS